MTIKLLVLVFISFGWTLKLGPTSGLSLYQNLIYYERVGLLLHSVNLACPKSLSSLLHLLSAEQSLPLRAIYNQSCENLMDSKRFSEIMSINNEDWQRVLTSPNCLVRIAGDKRWLIENDQYQRRPEIAMILATKESALQPEIIDSDLVRFISSPLQHHSCEWIRTVSPGIKPAHLAGIWGKMHPYCMYHFTRKADESAMITFAMSIVSLDLEDCSSLGTLLKLFNMFHATNIHKGEIEDRVARLIGILQSLIIKRILDIVKFIMSSETRPPWLLHVMELCSIFNDRKEYTGQFKYQLLLDHLAMENPDQVCFWKVQLALLYFNISGKIVHHDDMEDKLGLLDLMTLRLIDTNGMVGRIRSQSIEAQLDLIQSSGPSWSAADRHLWLRAIPFPVRLLHLRSCHGILHFELEPQKPEKKKSKFTLKSTIVEWLRDAKREPRELTRSIIIRLLSGTVLIKQADGHMEVQVGGKQEMILFGILLVLRIFFGFKVLLRFDREQLLCLISTWKSKDLSGCISLFKPAHPNTCIEEGLEMVGVILAGAIPRGSLVTVEELVDLFECR